MQNRGFTLVELAIVITIIGLLIGGVLKGQELLENARMTSAGTQLKAFNASTVTFRDVYKAYPGDIATPANFIQNCTTSPCNISGNADGKIGGNEDWGTNGNENNNFWLHMAKAGMISGIDPAATWSSGAFFSATSPQPGFPMGGFIGMSYCLNAGTIRNGTPGHYWHSFAKNASNNAAVVSIPQNKIAKYDLKFDDGKPTTGDVVLRDGSNTGANYDPNDSNNAFLLQKAEF